LAAARGPVDRVEAAAPRRSAAAGRAGEVALVDRAAVAVRAEGDALADADTAFAEPAAAGRSRDTAASAGDGMPVAKATNNARPTRPPTPPRPLRAPREVAPGLAGGVRDGRSAVMQVLSGLSATGV
jgi:hypothetical protein